MIIKLYHCENYIEFIETGAFSITSIKNMYPELYGVKIYSNEGKFLYQKFRPFRFIYKSLIFKSKKIQKKLEELKVENQN